jgi:hypothetical protein
MAVKKCEKFALPLNSTDCEALTVSYRTVLQLHVRGNRLIIKGRHGQFGSEDEPSTALKFSMNLLV